MPIDDQTRMSEETNERGNGEGGNRRGVLHINSQSLHNQYNRFEPYLHE